MTVTTATALLTCQLFPLPADAWAGPVRWLDDRAGLAFGLAVFLATAAGLLRDWWRQRPGPVATCFACDRLAPAAAARGRPLPLPRLPARVRRAAVTVKASQGFRPSLLTAAPAGLNPWKTSGVD